jgi:hypothetical protein
MGESMRLRSGLSEGLDVTLRLRKPAHAMELHDWMAQDVVPMHAALDEIWTRWDQDGVRLANDVVGKCMNLLGTSTASQPAKAESVSASGQWGNAGHPRCVTPSRQPSGN